MRVAKDKRLANLSVEQIMKIDKPSFEKLKQMVRLEDNLLAAVLNGDDTVLVSKNTSSTLENTYNDILSDEEFQALRSLNKKGTVIFFVEKLRAIINVKPSNNISYEIESEQIS